MNKCNMNARYTFELFTVLEENLETIQAVEEAADAPGKVHNPLYLYGPAGTGKTHLLHAIGNRILQDDPNLAVVYLRAGEFAERCTECSNGQPSAVDAMLQSADVLLFDELEMLGGKMLAQEVLLDLLESLRANGKQVVIASAKAPQDVHGILLRLQAQFSSGCVARLQMSGVQQEDLWKRVLSDIKPKIDPDAFATWFITAQGKETEEAFEIVSPNEFSCDWLEFRYGTLLTETIHAVSRRKLPVRFLVTEGENGGWSTMDGNNGSYATVRKDLRSIRQLTERLLTEQQKTNALLERLLQNG